MLFAVSALFVPLVTATPAFADLGDSLDCLEEGDSLCALPKLGIVASDVAPPRCSTCENGGVDIITITPGLPPLLPNDAYTKGLRNRDVIQAVDGIVLVDPPQLIQYLENKAPGTTVNLHVFRPSSNNTVGFDLNNVVLRDPLLEPFI